MEEKSTKVAKDMINQAAHSIEEIQFKGKGVRQEIGTQKDLFIEAVSEHFSKQRQSDAKQSEKRRDLLAQLKIAASNANIAEMKRIQKLLNSL